MIRLLPYALAASIAAGVVWYVMALRENVASLTARNERLSASLTTCTARATNLIEDKESDDAIDNLSNDDLRSVPDGWLVPDEDTAAGID